MQREQFIQRAIRNAQECRKGFHHKDSINTDVSMLFKLYHGASKLMTFRYFFGKFYNIFQLQCNDVVLFWRIQKMLQITSNSLRQQIMNYEGTLTIIFL